MILNIARFFYSQKPYKVVSHKVCGFTFCCKFTVNKQTINRIYSNFSRFQISILDFNKKFQRDCTRFQGVADPLNKKNKKIELTHPKDIFDFKAKQIDEDKNDNEDMPSQTDNLPGVENITTARMLECHRRDGYFQ